MRNQANILVASIGAMVLMAGGIVLPACDEDEEQLGRADGSVNATDAAAHGDGLSDADAPAPADGPSDVPPPGDGAGDAQPGDSAGVTVLELAVCDPTRGPFSLTIDNPYFPLAPGKLLVFEGMAEGTMKRLEIRVLAETEVVAGVTTRVMEERETEDGELVEVSRNFFVQAPDGTVCYYGEDVDIYEGGVVTSHMGAWRAGGVNRPGIIMPAMPAVGMVYTQELAPGIAMDMAEIVAIQEPLTVPAGTFTDSLRTRESTPLEPGVVDTKSYVRGVGLAVDGVLRLVSQ